MHWTVALEGGPRRVNHAAVAIETHVYTFGGYCTGEDYETARPMDVHMLNTVTYKWMAIPVPKCSDPQYRIAPYMRYGHTAVAHNRLAYLWGGRNDTSGACNILYVFDTESRKWFRPKVHGNIPSVRDGHSACIIRHKMLIFGGYEEEMDKFSNDVHGLDLTSLTWEYYKVSKGEPARWRDFHSATGIGDKMYIFGGRSDKAGSIHTNNEMYCNKMQIFDTVTCSWSEPATTGCTPIGRRSHSAFLYYNKLYIFGGYNGLHDLHLRDLHCFDPALNHWSFVTVQGQGPCPRRRQCCCVVGDRVFLFGGTSPCKVPMENTEFDLMDLSDLYVLDLMPTLRTLCLVAALDFKLNTDILPMEIRWELAAMTTNSNISRPLVRCSSG
ncbi:unnamed protein product [Owenia fusiformis]|uniref:Uncharacterized protein n=1 Tax=Owenia fusiformis TaxID=6347 RepID=A0A8J1XXD4_OWEFU|nr:unnamed protein product [Owenia fusiformis]